MVSKQMRLGSDNLYMLSGMWSHTLDRVIYNWISRVDAFTLFYKGKSSDHVLKIYVASTLGTKHRLKKFFWNKLLLI